MRTVPPLCAVNYALLPNDVEVNVVEFHIAENREEVAGTNGWQRQAALLTGSSLEHLMQVDIFRLPGETDAEAAHRQHRKGFYG